MPIHLNFLMPLSMLQLCDVTCSWGILNNMWLSTHLAKGPIPIPYPQKMLAPVSTTIPYTLNEVFVILCIWWYESQGEQQINASEQHMQKISWWSGMYHGSNWQQQQTTHPWLTQGWNCCAGCDPGSRCMMMGATVVKVPQVQGKLLLSIQELINATSRAGSCR